MFGRKIMLFKRVTCRLVDRRAAHTQACPLFKRAPSDPSLQGSLQEGLLLTLPGMLSSIFRGVLTLPRPHPRTSTHGAVKARRLSRFPCLSILPLCSHVKEVKMRWYAAPHAPETCGTAYRSSAAARGHWGHVGTGAVL